MSANPVAFVLDFGWSCYRHHDLLRHKAAQKIAIVLNNVMQC